MEESFVTEEDLSSFPEQKNWGLAANPREHILVPVLGSCTGERPLISVKVSLRELYW